MLAYVPQSDQPSFDDQGRGELGVLCKTTGLLIVSVQSHHTPQALLLGLEGSLVFDSIQSLTRIFRF